MDPLPVFDKPLGSFFNDRKLRVIGPLSMFLEYGGKKYPVTFPSLLICFLESYVGHERLQGASFHIEELPSGRYAFIMREGETLPDTLLWIYSKFPTFL